MDLSCRKNPAKPELLSPGGSLEKLRIAFLYGADAVYASGKDFGLRGFANNFDEEELAAACRVARGLGKKLYVTVNIFARSPDLEKLPPYLEYLQGIGVDALIITDPGVLLLARKYAPDVAVHLSTQANTTNCLSVKFWSEQGVRRINLARELSFQEIAEIVKTSEAQIEIFVHGAMCMSYSGRCMMSAFLNPSRPAGNSLKPSPANRSANGGFCTQPCRWSWGLVEEKRPGQFFPMEQDSHGTYILNSKDLCLLEDIGPLVRLGIDSFKIEGRMKGALYVASVTRAYRQAIDRFAEHPSDFGVEPAWREDLQRISHRPYTKGGLFACQTGGPDVETHLSYVQTHTLAGLVRSDPRRDEQGVCVEGEKIYFEARSRLVPGQTLEFLNPDGSTSPHLLGAFEDVNGNLLTQAHPNTLVRFCVDFPAFPLQAARVSNMPGRATVVEFLELGGPMM